MALPRFATHGGTDVALPRPLPPSDAARIKLIFSLQARDKIPDAMREMDRLEDTSLVGHLLADRYLKSNHRSTAIELADWLGRFSEQPDAPAVYALLQRRAPKGTKMPPVPVTPALSGDGFADAVPEEIDPPDRAISRNPTLDRKVAEYARDGSASAALRLIASTRGLSSSYAEQLRAEVAQILFTLNRDAEALDIAATAMQRARPDQQVVLAGYVAGLAAWRLDLPDLARGHFEAAARAPIGAAALRAGAAFWAARANLRTGNPSGYIPWMRRAAEEKRTFHGQLALRALGQSFWAARNTETLGEADIEAVGATPQGRRAFALLQVEQPARAEAELRALWPQVTENPALGRSLLLVASAGGLTDLAAQFAGLVQAADGRPRDDLRFPVPRLAPRGGFKVDPALVYALTRLESNFDAKAVSPAGARGLMQLMPVTAKYISGDKSVDGPRLHDPAINLELGQRYVRFLANQEPVAGNLIRLLASYNSGIGSFNRWSANLRDNGDPLLFIEAIPLWETRSFIQRVLAYSWIYAARLRLPSPSLDELSAGAFPRFVPLANPGSIRSMASLSLH